MRNFQFHLLVFSCSPVTLHEREKKMNKCDKHNGITMQQALNCFNVYFESQLALQGVHLPFSRYFLPLAV
jgi:hypothetical protein